ncbi:MAG: ATP-binding protein [Bacilli bacterium]|nr:ATP-binding protein [Bacilli bacterium]
MGQYIIQIPPAKSLIAGIRSIGYSFAASVADIIDNSITAKATEINIYADPLDVPYFAILDNGLGMDYKELKNAMTFGSDRSQKIDNELDLGRFGLGLKSASLSQCRKMTVISKAKSCINAMCYDLDDIEEQNDWRLEVLTEEEFVKMPCYDQLTKYETGTLVIWQEFDKLDALATNFVTSFRNAVADAKRHVELVFHYYYDSVNIYFNNDRIEKRDPFLINSAPRQQTGRTDFIHMDGSIITITPYTLPFANTLTIEEKKLLGNTNIYDEQGFYIYRNKRLIIWGSWLHMNVRSELSKLARVKIEIPSTLDKEWSLDVKKSTAKIPDKIKDSIKASLEDSVHRSKRTTRFRGVKEQQFEDKVWNRINLRDGFVKYELNKDNPIYKLLSENLSENDKKLLDSFIFQIEMGLPKYSIQNDTLDDLKIVNDSDSSSQEELIEQVCKDLECIPDRKKEAILEELLKTDVYKSISDKRELIIERIGAYV